MEDIPSLLPTLILWNLSDNIYEKHKDVAMEVEGVVRTLTTTGDHEKLSEIITMMAHEFALSPKENHQKGA